MINPQKDFASQEVVVQIMKSATSMTSLSPVHGEEAGRPDQPLFLNMESFIFNGSHKTILRLLMETKINTKRKPFHVEKMATSSMNFKTE